MNILSYGGGVNSTACLLLVMEDERFTALRPGLQVVFADTGGEWPETYEYMEQVFVPFIRDRYALTITVVRDVLPLEEKALKQKMVPVRVNRWCTDHAKIRPIHKLYEGAALVRQIIGIDYGELHRMRDSGEPGVENVYPLIDAKMRRPECREYLTRFGLPVPRKSGCWFCPFQRRGSWVELARKYPLLFQRAVALERNGAQFEKGMVLSDIGRPLEEWVPPRLNQLDLFDDSKPEGYCIHGCEIE